MRNKYRFTCGVCCALMAFAVAALHRKPSPGEAPEAPIPLLTVQEPAGVEAVAVSPDGQLAAVTSGLLDGNRIKLWDCRRKLVTHTLQGHRGFVLQAAFTADGGKLLSISYDAVHVWDVADGRLLHTMPGRPGFASTHALHVETNQLATVNYEGDLFLWDLATGVSRLLVRGHPRENRIISLAFGPEGRTLAYGNGNGEIHLLECHEPRELAVLTGPATPVLTLAFAPDGKHVASSGNLLDSVVRIWDLDARCICAECVGHTGFIPCLCFSPDGALLASGSSDATVRLWNPSTGEEKCLLRRHGDRVGEVIFSSDGRRLISRSLDGTAQLWQLARTGARLGHRSQAQNALGHFQHLSYHSTVTLDPEGDKHGANPFTHGATLPGVACTIAYSGRQCPFHAGGRVRTAQRTKC